MHPKKSNWVAWIRAREREIWDDPTEREFIMTIKCNRKYEQAVRLFVNSSFFSGPRSEFGFNDFS